MSHVILFTDRASEQRHRFNSTLSTVQYNFLSGAYKVASVLRKQGLTVLVVPNCFNLSWAGVQHIIDNNSENLLWVGLSTTFFTIQVPKTIELYRSSWHESKSFVIDTEVLYQLTSTTTETPWDMVWSAKEFSKIAKWLLNKHKVPLLLGGKPFPVWHQTQFDSNAYWVKGDAESYVKKFTNDCLADKQSIPPLFVNNSDYDNNDFKTDIILYNHGDHINSDDWLPIEIARGCAFNCAYCTYEHKDTTDLYKNPAVLRDELLRNYEMFGVTKYMLMDDLYNDSKDKIRLLYDQVWSKLPFTPEWTSYLRLDMLWADPESVDIIKASGARYATFGVETLHDTAGRKVGKGLGKQRILDTLQTLKDSWQDSVLYNLQMIAGLPHEPIESILESLEWSKTTTLAHSISWNPLVISKDFLISAMEVNNNKYGVTWSGKEWKNSVGVTKQMVDESVGEYYKNNEYYRVHLGNYPELRSAGLSHQDIVTVPKTPLDDLPLTSLGMDLKQKVNARLEKILSISNKDTT